MLKLVAALLLATFALAMVGCHGSAHADDTGVGASVAPNH